VPSPTVTPVAIADSTAFLMVSMPLAHGGSFCRLGAAHPVHAIFELAFADPRGAAIHQQRLLLSNSWICPWTIVALVAAVNQIG
jgi:hypothetical protein